VNELKIYLGTDVIQTIPVEKIVDLNIQHFSTTIYKDADTFSEIYHAKVHICIDISDWKQSELTDFICKLKNCGQYFIQVADGKKYSVCAQPVISVENNTLSISFKQ